MRTLPLATGLILALLTVLAPSHALEGQKGYTATALFTAADVRDEIVYGTGFAGVPWANLDEFALGSWQSTGTGGGSIEARETAIDAAGVVFFLVSGRDSAEGSTIHTGLVRYDGSLFEALSQDDLLFTGSGLANSYGAFTRTVAVSPITQGRLTAGHPVISRYVRGEVGGDTTFEIVSLDPNTSPAAETLVYSWASALNPKAVVAIDGAGALYVLGLGLYDDLGSLLDGTIRKLVWNGSGYDETSLTSLAVGSALALGSDGALYTFPQYAPWGRNNASFEIFRIGAGTGAWSVHATVACAGTWFHGWTWDSAGKFWIALTDRKNDFGYVVEVPANGTLTTRSARKRIAEWTSPRLFFRGISAGPDDELYGLEEGGSPLDDPIARRLNDALYLLTPGDDGGGKPGKGKGGGK